MRNEEVVGVVRFDGALVGTKKSGVQQLVSLMFMNIDCSIYTEHYSFQVGEICLTSNDMNMRSEKMKTGRVACLVKMFPGHQENPNMRLELKSLAALNEAMQDERKVFHFN